MRQRDGDVLSWGTPVRKMTTQAWQEISADGAPPGVYTPNMSDADMRAWKAKMAGQRTPGELRAEIRKTVSSEGTDGACAENRWARDKGRRAGAHAQVLLLVYADGEVRMSGNGTMAFSQAAWAELERAVAEARTVLAQYEAEESYQALPQRVREAVEAL